MAIQSKLSDIFKGAPAPADWLKSFRPVTRTLPVSGQTYQSPVIAPPVAPVPAKVPPAAAPTTRAPIFTQRPAPVVNPIAPLTQTHQGNADVVPGTNTFSQPQAQPGLDYSKYTDPTTGRILSPQEYADMAAKRMSGGDIPTYAGNATTQGPQTVAQLTGTATDLNNQRNDIATGESDPYGVASQSGIAYSPTELAAIEKAYAGIYDPALKDVFARLDTKEKADAAAQKEKDMLSEAALAQKNRESMSEIDRKNELEKMAQQHRYDLELKSTPTGKAGGGTSSGGGVSGVSIEGSKNAGTTGDFAGTIDLVSNMESSVAGKKLVNQQLKSLIANKDYGTAYAQIANTIENGLTGESKQKYVNARTDLAVMEGMKKAIQKYAADGGDMGLLKGTEEEIKRKLGIDSGKASSLATQLWREFQVYRNNMTGAAFGAGESRDYAAVNPSLGKSLDLNLSVIQGAQDQLKNRVVSTIDQRVPSAKYIREYAEGVQPSAAKGSTQPTAGATDEYQKWLQENNLN